MRVVKQPGVLTGLQVQTAMRRHVDRLNAAASIGMCIHHMVKAKCNAVLVEDHTHHALGVVSKTDLLGAYSAGLPLEAAIADIMSHPPMHCSLDDELDHALDTMGRHGIHRLFVAGVDAETIIGSLSYADVVGLLYRYCRSCAKGRRKTDPVSNKLPPLKVQEVMTPRLQVLGKTDTIFSVVETLSTKRLGAILIEDEEGMPVGVISKTDLIIAYLYGTDGAKPASSVMHAPVVSCHIKDLLSAAIRQMLLNNLKHLFVHRENDARMVGVLSLSDAPRFRSGTCSACIASRRLVSR